MWPSESHQQPMKPATLYSLALVRAHRGLVEDARELATEALALCERTGNVPLTSMVLSVLGFIALSLDDHQAAHSHLGRLAEANAAVGLGEPSVVKYLPNEIEALAALGEMDLARSFAQPARRRGDSLSGGRGRWRRAHAAARTSPPRTVTVKGPWQPASVRFRTTVTCPCLSNSDGRCSSRA